MAPPEVFPLEPPKFHPEFGYLWPAVHTRRMVRAGLMSTAFGLLFGAIAVLAMSPRADPDPARAATALSAVPADELATVGATTSAVAVAKTQKPPKAAKKREKTAKTRQRERDREAVDTDRGRFADPRSAYASPYGSRYETPRRAWGR